MNMDVLEILKENENEGIYGGGWIKKTKDGVTYYAFIVENLKNEMKVNR